MLGQVCACRIDGSHETLCCPPTANVLCQVGDDGVPLGLRYLRVDGRVCQDLRKTLTGRHENQDPSAARGRVQILGEELFDRAAMGSGVLHAAR